MVWLYTLASVFLVSIISLVGILTLVLRDKTLNKLIIYIVGFSAGAMLGDVFFHLLPEMVEHEGHFDFSMSLFILVGICLSFFLEKVIHWNHCHHPTTKNHVHPFATMTLVGDTVHNFIDGIIIAASYLVSIPVGIATTIAVVVHEIPQELGNFGVLVHGGFSKWKALAINFLSALSAFLGAILTLAFASGAEELTHILIPIAIGNFVYIAGSDLLPEMHKVTETKKSIIQLLVLVAGMAVMYGLLFLGHHAH